MESYDDWTAVVGDLRKARKRWERMSSIIGREGAYPRTLGNFYKAVFQYTLLFRAESWVVSPWVGSTLGGFHHRVSHWMEKIHPKQTGAGTKNSSKLDRGG